MKWRPKFWDAGPITTTRGTAHTGAGMKRKKRGLKKFSFQQAKPPAAVSLPPPPWDRGASGPANQARLVDTPATEIDAETGKETPNPNGVTRRQRVGWIAIYWTSGKLTDAQYNAAIELRHASEGNLNADPLTALQIDRTPCGDPQASAFDARRKYHRMIAEIPRYCLPIIERVVLNDQPIWRPNGPSAARHLARLTIGLQALVDKRW